MGRQSTKDVVGAASAIPAERAAARGGAREPERRSRLPLLMGVLAALALALAWVWQEPLRLAALRNAPVPELERFAAEAPDSAPRVLALGEAYLRAGRVEEAVRLLTGAVQRQEADPRLRTLLGRALLESGQLPVAYGHLRLAATTLHSEDPATQYWLGQVLERSDRVQEAAECYRSILKTRPEHPLALLRLAQLARAENRLTEAEQSFRKALAASPRSAEAAAGLAETEFRLGRPEEAVRSARIALQVAPAHPQGNLWLARALQACSSAQTGGDAAARTAVETQIEEAYRVAIRYGQDPLTPRYFLAQFLRERGRTAEALRELKANTAANNLHKGSYYELALCARSLKQPAEAQAALARYRKLDRLDLEGSELEYRVWVSPENPHARLQLARYYLEHGRPDLAAPELERVLVLRPGNPEALRLQARAKAHPHPAL